MAINIYPRPNWTDGQEVVQSDLVSDQTAWLGTIANLASLTEGSGVEKDTAVQNVIFDTNNVPASLQSIISAGNFDGLPIYPTDTFGNTVFVQPSDTSQGNQLQVTISGANLSGAITLKVYIFGITYGGNFVQEVLDFTTNNTMVTYNYYTSIVAMMFQNFLGNQNTLIDGYGSYNVGGRCLIYEALPMTVVRDTVMASQTIIPNMDYVNFKPSNETAVLSDLLTQIANSANLSASSLNVITTSTSTRLLSANQSAGIIVGEKFKATTNNIQKVTVLLAVQQNTLAAPGEQYNFSGDIIVGIYALQTTVTCPTDIIPGNAINFDPEPSSLAEIALAQSDIEQMGIVLNGQPQEVDFIFTESLLANPSLSPLIAGNYYAVTIRRSGDISVGNIILQEALKTTSGVSATTSLETVFSNNVWNDIPTQDLWFTVWTDAIRITAGTAIDAGTQISSPKIVLNETTGVNQSFVDGPYGMLETSSGAPNYVIVQKSLSYSAQLPQPATGNLYYSREEDVTSTSVVTQASLFTLINSGANPIILGSIVDTNPVGISTITGTTIYPGLAGTNTFTIINPSATIVNSNLLGSIITPNTIYPGFTYRIVGVQVFKDAYGDANGDGLINTNDVALVQSLDGYSKTLTGSPLWSNSTQQQNLVDGYITMQEILRGNVTGSGLINIVDAQLIQEYINSLDGYLSEPLPFPAGVYFTRVVLTLESVLNPLTTPISVIGDDPSFNNVPFTSINYSIDVLPQWKQENLIITDLRRFVLKTFTSLNTSDITSSPPNGGKNSVFIPGDVLISGDLLNPDGTNYSIDLEVTSIVLELPAGNTAVQLDVFNNLIKGKLSYFDGTLVAASDLAANKIFVTTAIESITKDDDLTDPLIIDNQPAIDESISILYSNVSGILTIRADNIRNLLTRPELRTKIILTVYLKKAGFKNLQSTISANQLLSVSVPL